MIQLLNQSFNQFLTLEKCVAEVVKQSLIDENDKFLSEYDPVNNKIIVKNTSDLPMSALMKIIYAPQIEKEYDFYHWYPVVQRKRNEDKNLEIKFSGCKPILFYPFKPEPKSEEE
jgi:hypothetical protein